MDFKCEIASSSIQSECFEFEWDIGQLYLKLELTSHEIASSLNDGISFQITVKKVKNRLRMTKVFQEQDYRMSVGLKRTDKKMCDVKTLLLFEIQNDSGKLYLRESFEKLFSGMYEACFCDHFVFPLSNQELRGRNGNIVFRNEKMIIKGKLFFQFDRESKNSAPKCKNIDRLQSDLKDLLQKEIYADIKFQIGDSILQAHKSILCSRSSVFRTMFEQNMREKETDCVKISDIEKPVFDAFLTFLYTGNIQDDKLDIVMPLYSVADKYAVDTLFESCSNILLDCISDTTVAPLLKLADMHSDETLKTAVVDFICKNFAKVTRTESWRELLNSDPHLASYALTKFSDTAAKKALRFKFLNIL